MIEMTLYNVLGVSEDATLAEIKKAYRTKSRFLHPDATQSADSTDLFQMVQAAYEVLSDETKRADYDAQLRQSNQPAPESAENSEPTWGTEETWEDHHSSNSQPFHNPFAGAGTPGMDPAKLAAFLAQFMPPQPVPQPPTGEAGEPPKNEDGSAGSTGQPSESQEAEQPAKHQEYSPDRLTWLRDAPDFEPQYVPPLRRRKAETAAILLGGTAAGLFLLFLLVVILTSGSSERGNSIALAIFTLSLLVPTAYLLTPLPKAVRRSKVIRFLRIPVILLAALTVLGGILLTGSALNQFVFALMYEEGTPIFPMIQVIFSLALWGLPLAAFCFAVPASASRFGSNHIAAADTARLESFGTPGQTEAAVTRFGAANVKRGIEGEERTAQLLQLFPRTIPSARVFHQLRFPTRRWDSEADVDHAVLVGNRLALVDSKLWRGNHYEWNEFGQIVESDGPRILGYRDSHFPNAVNGYAQRFPTLEVMGWILIHPGQGRAQHLSFDNTYATNTLLADAQTAMESIGNWLLGGNQVSEVNRRTLNGLIASLK